MNKRLETVELYLENAVDRLKNRKSIKDEIDVLWFLRGICRELQYYTRKDKKQIKAFSNRAKVFQYLMTMKRKEARKCQK